MKKSILNNKKKTMKLNENRVLRLAGLITENDYAKLQEMEFATQKAFDNYSKQHDIRPDTKVTVAGKATTAGQAAKKSEPIQKGKSVFDTDDTDNSTPEKGIFGKVKNFFSKDARRPTDDEFNVAAAHFKSYGDDKGVDSIGVDRKTGNINASNGEYEVILSPSGKLLKKDTVQSKYDDMQADIDREGEKYRKRQQQIGKLKSFIGLDEHNKK